MSFGPSKKPHVVHPGEIYGSLTVVEYVGSARYRRVYRCTCVCGKTVHTLANKLTGGGIRSCGCSRRTHGGHDDPEYNVWIHIIHRCHNPTDPAYARYGGRGIKVCEEWRESYATFIRDMGRRPAPDLTLERKDNDGPYSPENCRWATRWEQARNTRQNRRYTIGSLTLCLTDWCNAYGINVSTVRQRLRNGMPIETALAAPITPRGDRRWKRSKHS